MKRVLAGVAIALLLVAVVFVILWRLSEREDPSVSTVAGDAAKGAYLARAANCQGCHTRRGGAAYAGGRDLSTPFGVFMSPNITPDRDTGIGQWTKDDFWRALHHGRGRDGRALYPVFPYPEYTRITREDADHLYAYLMTLAPVREPRFADYVRFPYSQRWLLTVWRALYFRPGTFAPDAARDAQWNRGAYLVQGAGHCNACHTARNALGASGGAALGGGEVAGQHWYAPSLTAPAEAGVQDWPLADIVQHLRTGLSPRGGTAGPMAEVVAGSLAHLTPTDLSAIATYLKSLPRTEAPRPDATPVAPERLAGGKRLYGQHCKDCHGEEGKGVAGAYPALRNNPSVTQASPLNAIRSLQDGGYTPVTPANPRPHGMPPFAQALNNEEIAQIVSYIRSAWGHGAGSVSAVDVDRAGSP